MVERDTPWPPGTPCWVDLMSTDPAGASAFYGLLFGWEVEVGPPETGGYAMASIDGRAVAGIGAQLYPGHPSAWNTYLATADAAATAAAIGAAGGTVIAPVMDVLDLGRMAIIAARGGGAFGIWEPLTHIGCQLANVDHSLTWNEFLTRDYAGALEFYAAVFGHTFTDIGTGYEYSTVEVDGNTVAGIGAMPPDAPEQVPPHWRTYFAVADTDVAVEKATSLGGTVLRPAADRPYGRHADLADPQGGRFTVIKPAS